MERRIYHRLVSVEEIENILSKYYDLKPLGVETIELSKALGRVLAEDIYSPIDHPPFDRSTVDGYAVRSNDLLGADELNPIKLVVKGYIRPGEKPGVEVGEGEAVEIATGSMIPRGADSVVMVEYTERKENTVLIYRSVAPGSNISVAGNDISAGDLVLVKGTLITPNIIGLLAGLGIDRVKVYVKPKAVVYSIGNEVVKPGEALEPGKVYDVNGYLITNMLNTIGFNAEYHGILPDDKQLLIDTLSKDLKYYDVLITSGGTSKGLSDLIYRVFNELGEPGVVIHGLKIKPGKPTVFAVINGKLAIGLPGFPLSCYMVLIHVVNPLLTKLTGMTIGVYQTVQARIAYKLKKPLGITWYIPVVLVKTRDGYTAYPVTMESGSISPLAYSDGFIALPENKDLIQEDTMFTTYLFRSEREIPRLNIIGSNDYLLYRLVSERGLMSYTRILPVGSTGGWYAVKRGEADIAPTHLLDEETLTYNTPFLDKFGLRGKVVLMKGYERLIGIIVAKGNPKKIESIRDFLREDVVIVNRTKGSGTRVYLDYMLKKIASEENKEFHELVKRIKGYAYEVKTHTAVAAAVKQGRADAGLGLGLVAKLYDLDFIPLTWEEYDFLIPVDKLEKPEVQYFIEMFRDKEFLTRIISRYKGYYRLRSDTGSFIQ